MPMASNMFPSSGNAAVSSRMVLESPSVPCVRKEAMVLPEKLCSSTKRRTGIGGEIPSVGETNGYDAVILHVLNMIAGSGRGLSAFSCWFPRPALFQQLCRKMEQENKGPHHRQIVQIEPYFGFAEIQENKLRP